MRVWPSRKHARKPSSKQVQADLHADCCLSCKRCSSADVAGGPYVKDVTGSGLPGKLLLLVTCRSLAASHRCMHAEFCDFTDEEHWSPGPLEYPMAIYSDMNGAWLPEHYEDEDEDLDQDKVEDEDEHNAEPDSQAAVFSLAEEPVPETQGLSESGQEVLMLPPAASCLSCDSSHQDAENP